MQYALAQKYICLQCIFRKDSKQRKNIIVLDVIEITPTKANYNFKFRFAAREVIDLLENVTDIFKDAQKTYVVGKGLTRTGVQQLGAKLAAMTIGDLEAFLDMSNLDAVEVHQIITDLIELATTLVRT